MNKFMSSLFFIAAISLFSIMSKASNFGLEVGFKQQSGESIQGLTSTSQVGFQFGVFGNFDLAERFAFKTGILYTQRPLKLKSDLTNLETNLQLSSFDIPIGLMLKFEDYMGAYIGTALSVNLDKSSSNKDVFSLTDVKSLVTPLQLGVMFKFMPDIGLNLYFEQYGDVAKDLKSYKSVGMNLFFTME